jgi:hypothetical protein
VLAPYSVFCVHVYRPELLDLEVTQPGVVCLEDLVAGPERGARLEPGRGDATAQLECGDEPPGGDRGETGSAQFAHGEGREVAEGMALGQFADLGPARQGLEKVLGGEAVGGSRAMGASGTGH